MKRGLITLALLALVGVTACTGAAPSPTQTTPSTATTKPPATTSPSATPTQTPAPTVKKPTGTLNIGLFSLGFEKFNPWEGGAPDIATYSVVYDFLLTIDQDTDKIAPNLATEWSMSEDGTAWTFKLRKGVQFHNGWGEFTSADVKYSIERTMAEGSKNSKAPSWRQNITAIETPDPYTVIVRMKQVNFGFDSDLTPRTCNPMVSKKYFEAVGDQKATEQPVGTGPYKFVEHKLGEYVKWEAVPDHWRVGTPEWQYIVIKAMPEEATRVNALLAGEVDMIPVSLDSVPRIQQAGLKLVSNINPSVSSLWFGGIITSDNENYNPDNPFLKREVREALNLAINRQEIINTIYRGQAQVATSQYLADGWKDLKPHPYDPARAKKLLADAGYPNGFSTEIRYHTQKPDLKPMCEAIAMYWEAIGIKVTLTPGEYANMRSEARTWKTQWSYPFSLGTYFDHYERTIGSLLDPEKTSGFFIALDPALFNIGRQLYGELDPAKRESIDKQVMSAMLDGYWFAPIAVTSDVWALGKNVGSWDPIPSALYGNMWETVTHAP